MPPFPPSYSWLRGRIRYCRTLLFARHRVRLFNRCPLISFTFDDFPRSALNLGGGILQKYGLAATYYTSLGLMNTDGPSGPNFRNQDLYDVFNRGHEVGCHTFDHCHAWNTLPNIFEESIRRNRQALSELLPEATFQTLSYPMSIPRPQTKEKVQKYFLCCRGGSQTLNSRMMDLNYVKAFFLEQSYGDAKAVKTMIDRNCQRCGWLIFATHDVAEKPSRYGVTPEFFEEVVRYAVASGATILPVAAAFKRTQATGY